MRTCGQPPNYTFILCTTSNENDASDLRTLKVLVCSFLTSHIMLHTLKHLSPSCGSICVSEIGMQEEVSHNTLLLNCCDARS
jgi:hypothetical protein